MAERPIGSVIAAYRKKNKLSLDAFADRCRLSKSYIYALEKGKQGGAPPSPTIQAIAAVAQAMGISTAALLMEMGVIDGMAKEREADAELEPFEYTEPTVENMKAALREERLYILPFKPPERGQDVYIPVMEQDGMVILNNVVNVYGGVYEAQSEALGSVIFTLFDIGRTVFYDRNAAYAKLNEWQEGKNGALGMGLKSQVPQFWSERQKRG